MRAQVRATSRYVVMRMTHKQLDALAHALGNSTLSPDVMETLFPDGRERRLAQEAARIVGEAQIAVHDRKAEGGAS